MGESSLGENGPDSQRTGHPSRLELAHRAALGSPGWGHVAAQCSDRRPYALPCWALGAVALEPGKAGHLRGRGAWSNRDGAGQGVAAAQPGSLAPGVLRGGAQQGGGC